MITPECGHIWNIEMNPQPCIGCLEYEIKTLTTEVKALMEVLRGVEWVGWNAMYNDECCVECGAPKPRGHTRNCVVAAALSGGKP